MEAFPENFQFYYVVIIMFFCPLETLANTLGKWKHTIANVKLIFTCLRAVIFFLFGVATFMIDSQALLQSLSSHSLLFRVSMVVQLKSGSYKAQQAFCQGVTTLTSRITFNYLDNYIYFLL